MVEYGLIVAVISLMALSAVALIGDSTEDTFTTIAAELEGQDADQGSSGNESDSDESDDQDSDAGDSDSSSDPDQDDEQGSDDEEDHDQQSDDDSASDDSGNGDDEQDDSGNDDDEQDDSGNDDDEQDDSGNDDSGNDDSGNDDSGNDDSGSDDDPQTAGPSPDPTASESKFYWWNSTRHGGNGAWTASVTYSNDTNRHQYLDLEITRVDEQGKKTASEYENFYVPANGSETYTHWSNSLNKHKGKLKGTVEVRVKVKSIKTSDENWQSYTYEVDEQPVSVEAPATP